MNQGLLNQRLFEIAGTPITVATLFAVVAVIVVTLLVAHLLKRGLEKALRRRGHVAGTASAVARLVSYGALASGGIVALQTAGIQLTALLAAGAVFAVGLGLAVQNIAQSFVSGIILLIERSIKPGDVLEVEGTIVRVRKLGVRAATARTRDGEDLIIPNSVLVQSTIKNYTLKDSSFRIRVRVGVVYRSDMAQVRQILEEVAQTVSARWGVEENPWQVVMTEFGDSSVSWEIGIWMRSPWEMRRALSELHEAVWGAFADRKIVIAFPQLDVHFDPPVTEGLVRLGTA
jgi:small-conductance mechanosensitive channel